MANASTLLSRTRYVGESVVMNTINDTEYNGLRRVSTLQTKAVHNLESLLQWPVSLICARLMCSDIHDGTVLVEHRHVGEIC